MKSISNKSATVVGFLLALLGLCMYVCSFALPLIVIFYTHGFLEVVGYLGLVFATWDFIADVIGETKG